MKVSPNEVKSTDVKHTTPLRFVTGSSLFDGHDAAINMIRRLLQSQGAEVIHLGHNRSVQELVEAAIQEDADALAVSSYQGGHIEFFRYMVDELKRHGAGHIQVFGGGGGVILPSEIANLQDYGVNRIYSPQDGQAMGLEGMIGDMIARAAQHRQVQHTQRIKRVQQALAKGPEALAADWNALTQAITLIENNELDGELIDSVRAKAGQGAPVLGITGTGGAGKSSLTDELIRRFRMDHDDHLKIAVVCVDPSRRKTGGALLGDRIRMNAISTWNDGPRVFMRSLATRESAQEVPPALPDVVGLCRQAGFDLVIVETPGIGQGDAAIVPLVSTSLYVMTPEFGAASQLEKIDMLDFADFVAVNKFDRKGAMDALRDVAKQVQRNRMAFSEKPEDMPVFGTLASHFNDDGVSSLYRALREAVASKASHKAGWERSKGLFNEMTVRHSSETQAVVPASRSRYLSEIAQTVRNYKHEVQKEVELTYELECLQHSQTLLGSSKDDLNQQIQAREQQLNPQFKTQLEQFDRLANQYSGDELTYPVRDKTISQPLVTTSLSGNKIRRISLPKFTSRADLLRFVLLENLPGYFPYTAGTFPLKRANEDPTRMFAGEGDPARTNRRFKMLSKDSPAKRLSTAFDSVTLYGFDPDLRPDIYGKVGTSGVSIATLDDMKDLYDGFDLCAPTTSVSMTINGP
ncbi:MAG: methylmalonyl-CoA mutase family protein, partial [Limnobacter sp.]|nr:methylmalonyl-CoA mutase family protein [Limnobacter sp.]